MKNRIIVYCAGGIAERIYFSLNDESNTVIAVADGNPAYSKGAVSYDEIPIDISPLRLRTYRRMRGSHW